MVQLYSLSYSKFFYSFPCFFVQYFLIYHCFPHSYLYRSIPLLRPLPLFVLIQYHSSISCDPFLQSLPFYVFHLVFGFSFPIPSPFSPLSPILPLKSPPNSIRSSLFSFIASSTHLLVVFISLMYIVIIFHHLLPL
jgi:hypothetical protein